MINLMPEPKPKPRIIQIAVADPTPRALGENCARLIALGSDGSLWCYTRNADGSLTWLPIPPPPGFEPEEGSS